MYSDKFKTVFVHVPRTGGQSVETVFVQAHGLNWKTRGALLLRENPNPEAEPKHLAHLYAAEYYELGFLPKEVFASCFKFMTVRNPYARMLSEYRYRAQRRSISFERFVRRVAHTETEARHIVPASRYLLDARGKVIVDKVMRLESLAADFIEISAQIFGQPEELPHANKSAPAETPDTIDDETRKEIYRRYESDFDMFKYPAGWNYRQVGAVAESDRPVQETAGPVAPPSSNGHEDRARKGRGTHVAAPAERALLNVVLVAQDGRIGYQALLCAASVRAHHPGKDVAIFVCVPNKTELWNFDPRLTDPDLIAAFERYGCNVVHFDNEHFGANYPHSNKFYAILSLPRDEPFLFLDSDTVLTGPIDMGRFDFATPGLTPARPNWPLPKRGKHTIAEIWESLYDMFDLDAAAYYNRALGRNEHQCYPYYQGNVMYYAGAGAFGETMLDLGRRLWREQPEAVKPQRLKPWLDQIVLPLVLAKLGVPRKAEPDQIRDHIVHYQFPFFLAVRNGRAIKSFTELTSDSGLVSVLRHDKGFDYYMSDEGREFVQKTYTEYAGSPELKKKETFADFMRSRAPIMR